MATATMEDRFQFIRKGYYCLDKDSTANNMVFNRTITLKDTWAKGGK
jgi:glutaminyl-tRNA synthetase